MNADAGTPHGPWRILDSREVYRDPWLSVRRDEVIRPDGKPGTHSVVTIKPGVCVLAFDARDVFLTEEFHYGVGLTTLEAVSGGRDDDESPLTCAKRELQEELGIVADHWTELTTVDPFTASVVSPTTLFLATGLQFRQANPEGTERIRCVRMSLKDAFAAVSDGRITHTPSCIVILQLWIRQQSSETQNG
ncbi:MAG: NUDIX hydrolase [Planctomycetaceae bacterium]|nr:NUDIX hydrolase [Planctomycetaceae bacterium]